MALLFMDSFDHLATADLLEKWGSLGDGSGFTSSINASGGRRGSGSLRATAGGSLQHWAQFGLFKALPAISGTTCVIGFALKWPVATAGTTGAALCSVRDGSTPQVTLRINSTLTLSAVRGQSDGTVLGTTTATIAAAAFTHIELKVTVHPSAGTVDVRINGVSVLSLTGQNTRQSANTQWTGITLGAYDSINNSFVSGASSATIDYDDLYVLDGSGSAPWTTFLGDCRVDARVPTAAGTTTQFTPSAGSNWQNVDDAVPNDDTDYNGSATVGQIDLFTVDDAPSAGATIFGVQHCVAMKKLDAGTCTVAPVIRHGGTNYVGADLAPATTYAYGLQIAQTNPGTGVQWTEPGFNAAEFGYKKTA